MTFLLLEVEFALRSESSVADALQRDSKEVE